MSSSSRTAGVLALFSFVLGGVGILALLAAGRPAQAPVDAGIRFVDMHRVLVNSVFFKAKFKGIEEEYTRRTKEMKALADRFDQKRKELKDMVPGMAETEKLGLEMAQLKARLEFMDKLRKRRLQRDEKRLEKMVYEMLRSTVSVYAKNKGLQAVLMIDEARGKTSKKQRLEQVLESNLLRGVLWHNPALDVTDAIIKMLNQG